MWLFPACRMAMTLGVGLPHGVPTPFLLVNRMTDNKELVTCIEDLRECVGTVDKRLQVLQVQLEPVVKIMQGNGKPGLPVRLHMTEQRMDVVEKTGAWVMRLAVTATVSALGTIVWALLKD